MKESSYKTEPSYKALLGTIVALWFAFSLTASVMHVFTTAPGRPPIPVGLAASLPIVLFLGWFAASRGFREFVLSLDASTLTFLQSWRIAGLTFVTLYTYHILPGMFALPAGWGDIFIGATAPLAAWALARPERRGLFIFWQVLGMTDLVTAVASGTTAAVLRPGGIGTDAMAVLPLSIIPTFAVPLFLIFHIICVAQASRWGRSIELQHGSTLPASA
jgi:hypothetical protein